MKKSFKEVFSETYKTLFCDFKNSLKIDLPYFSANYLNLKLRLSEALSPNSKNVKDNPVTLFLISNKKIWIGIFLSVLMLLMLILVVRPYSLKSQNQLSLNHSQADHLKKLITDFHFTSNIRNPVESFSEQDLVKLRQLLLSKGFKPTQLAFDATNGANIQIQLNHVAFASFLDLVNEVREMWHIYPVEMSVVGTNSPGIVNIEAKLVQFRHEKSNRSTDLVSH